MTVEPIDLEQYERSYCGCDMCKAACHNMPGMLAPGDLQQIAVECDKEPTDLSWVNTHFCASAGAAVLIDGNPARIPTIVPAQKPNGHCVFLNDEDRCEIHRVAPFGCRCFNVCDEENREEDLDSSSACLAQCAADDRYRGTWAWLRSHGSIASPLRDRRSALQAELDEI